MHRIMEEGKHWEEIILDGCLLKSHTNILIKP